MTENPTPEPQPADVDAAFDLNDWIQGISPTLRSVDIYGRTDLFGRYERLERELAIAEQVEQAAEASVTEGSEVARILREMEELYELQQRSKTTWYVQALDSTVIKAISDAHPVPDPLPKPAEPAKNAPDPVKGKYRTELKAWEKKNRAHEEKRRAAADEQNLHLIAAAVVRIENHEGVTVAEQVTVDQLRALQAKPHGAMQTGALLQKAFEAKAGEPVIPAPFSHSRSGSTKG